MNVIFIRSIEKKDRQRFIIEWTDGKISSYRCCDVQRRCPCARCLAAGPLEIDENVEVVRITSIGNYALQFFFTKGCSKGIYSFQWLRQI